jgi:hypothetical protein
MLKRVSLFTALHFVISVLFMPTISAADVRVSGFIDFNFGTWSGGSGLSSSSDLCVYKSSGDSYFVTASGSGSGGAFSVQDGGNSIGYTVDWARKNNAFTTLATGVASNFNGANESSTDCGGVMTSTLRVNFSDTNLQSAVPGIYSGELTILVEP